MFSARRYELGWSDSASLGVGCPVASHGDAYCNALRAATCDVVALHGSFGVHLNLIVAHVSMSAQSKLKFNTTNTDLGHFLSLAMLI